MRKRLIGTVFAVPLLIPPLGATEGPAKAGEFLTWCRDHGGGCADRIASVEDQLVAIADKRYCAPIDGDVTGGIPKVQSWLAARAEEQARDTDLAIADGWIALYPCKT